MSHFAVMVFTEQYPTKEVLDKALAPWHEYECSGIKDEYVIHVDETENALSTYETSTVTFYKDPMGNEHPEFIGYYYNPILTRLPTKEEENDWKNIKRTSNDLIFEIPDGFQKIKYLLKDKGISILEHIKDYYGVNVVIQENDEIPSDSYILTDEEGNFLKYYKYTNPNAKWDWWQIGGRYTGRLHPDYDPQKDPSNQEIGFDGKSSVKWPSDWRKFGGDIKEIKNLDIEKISAKYREKVANQYDKLIVNFDKNFLLFDEILCDDWTEKRKIYNEQPAIKNQSRDLIFASQDTLKLLRDSTRDEYIEANWYSWFVPYAFIHNGHWYEKGLMGWFGVSSNEKDPIEWNDKFFEILKNPGRANWVTVVDCHI